MGNITNKLIGIISKRKYEKLEKPEKTFFDFYFNDINGENFNFSEDKNNKKLYLLVNIASK